MRALIQRPRRKMHLAFLDGDGLTWTTYCDLTVLADGATVQEFDPAGGPTTRLVLELRSLIGPRSSHLCAHCRRFVLLIELLRVDRRGHQYDLEDAGGTTVPPVLKRFADAA